MRLLEIIFYLLKTRRRVTIKELAEKFNVSTKTIQRDLDKLSVEGIPIVIYRGKNGGVEVDTHYFLSRYMLKYNDYESLIMALCICENISKNISESSLIDVFKVVDYEKYSKILNKFQERFVVDLYDEKFDIKNKICEEIDKAMDNKTFIEIKVNDSNLEVFPISYVLRKEGLCLYCYNNEEYKLILINEISNVISINKSYDGNISSYFDNKENLNLL